MTDGRGREPRAELRTLRLCTGVVGVSSLAATIATLLVVSVPDQLGRSVPSWGFTAAAMLLPLLVAACSPWSSLRVLRRLNALVVVEHGLLLLLTLVITSGSTDGGRLPWVLTLPVVPVAAALVAWGRGPAWLVLAVSAGAVQVLRAQVSHDTLNALASDVQAFFVSVALLLLFSMLITVSRQFDSSTRAAYRHAAQRSADEARTGVRRRLQALVHDELLTTLVLAARDAPPLRAAVADQAARTRRQLGQLREPASARSMSTDLVLRQLRATAAQEAPDAGFEVKDRRSHAGGPGDPGLAAGAGDLGGADGDVALDVAEALVGALRQALVNSRTHAGPQARRRVAVTLGDDLLRVTITDDGAGFDLDQVPAARLGVSGSIVGRMRGAPGGDARVESAVGAGTRVVLLWERSPDATAGTPEEPIESTGVLPADDAGLRTGLLVLISVFWLAQVGLAALATATTGHPAVPVAALAGVALSFLALGWRSLAPPGRLRSWTVVTLTLGTVALSLLPVARDPERYGDTWYVAACGAVLLVLAVRGRPGTAILGGLLCVTLAALSAHLRPDDVTDLRASTSRHAAILVIGVLLSLGIARVRARTAAVRAAELVAVRTQGFREAAARELQERSRALEEAVGQLLVRLEEGTALSEAERRECAALDGRLRDQYRGGRISRPPLIEAAMSARRRGVDVVLLDDAGERALDDDALHAVAVWMADRLDTVREGRFTGRVLPGGREALASVVVGDDVVELPAFPRRTTEKGG